MGKRWIVFSLLFIGLLPDKANAQSCQQICSQLYSFSRQSRGDWAFVQEVQRLSNACQSCQLQQRVRPQATNPQPTLPQWNSQPVEPVLSAHDRALAKAFTTLDSLGEWAMRGAVLPQGAPLSAGTVKAETYTPPPDYVDPFAQKGPTTITSKGNGYASGNIYDPNQQSSLKPAQQANQPTTSLGPNTTYPYSAPCSGFNAPDGSSPCK
jgi:hypothetical protein